MSRPADAVRDLTSPLADPGMRLAARIIDAAALLLPVVLLILAGTALRSPRLTQAALVMLPTTAIILAGLNLYWLHRYGQTVGKRALGLRIVRRNGERAPLGRIFFARIWLPNLIGAIPLFGTLFSLGDSLMIFSEERRTVHDRFADTIVVDLVRDAPEEPGAGPRATRDDFDEEE